MRRRLKIVGSQVAIGVCVLLPIGLLASRSAAAGVPLRGSAQPAASERAPAAAALRARLASAATNRIAPYGSLFGQVRNADGRPMSGICVSASLGRGGFSDASLTTAEGNYFFGRVPQGSYRLRFSSCGAAGRYFPETYSAVNGHRIVVTSGSTERLAPVMMRATHPMSQTSTSRPRSRTPVASAPHGYISGVVTDRHGHPIKGICVYVLPIAGGGSLAVSTSRTGTYTSLAQAPGSYEVEFQGGCGNTGNWLPQIYDNKSFLGGTPTPVVVVAGHTTSGIDARLQTGGEISGQVTNAKGKALGDVCVAVSTMTANFGFVDEFASAPDGSYDAGSLAPGPYTVEFSLGCGQSGDYAPQWYKLASTAARATMIKISSGKVVTGVNGVLLPGADIAGRVTLGSATDLPLSGICVFASNYSGSETALATTRTNGTYKLIGLGTASYLVQFEPGCGNNGDYLNLQYPRAIKAVDGKTTAGINAWMRPGGAITGTVTDSSGQLLTGICLQIQQISGSSAYNGGGFSPVTTNGAYSITQLPTGHYEVEFFGGCGNEGSYAPQWYRGESSGMAADVIDVVAGKTTTGINAVMQPGATVSGVVNDAAGHLLSGVCVGVANTSQLQLSFGGFQVFQGLVTPSWVPGPS